MAAMMRARPAFRGLALNGRPVTAIRSCVDPSYRRTTSSSTRGSTTWLTARTGTCRRLSRSLVRECPEPQHGLREAGVDAAWRTPRRAHVTRATRGAGSRPPAPRRYQEHAVLPGLRLPHPARRRDL